MTDLHPSQRTLALAESNVLASSAALLAPLAIGRFAGFGPSWQTAMLVAIPALAMLAWRFWSAPIPPAPAPIEFRHQQAQLPRTFWILFAVLFLVMPVEWCIAYWEADFLTDEVGLDRAIAATVCCLVASSSPC